MYDNPFTPSPESLARKKQWAVCPMYYVSLIIDHSRSPRSQVVDLFVHELQQYIHLATPYMSMELQQELRFSTSSQIPGAQATILLVSANRMRCHLKFLCGTSRRLQLPPMEMSNGWVVSH
ncbi:hypothetical protein JB92DRAFT_2879804 [Gautieria morchelliformis]|nr:hypothetical protein JB92DRAFT_2879804 [Gautieria morchelliformis]